MPIKKDRSRISVRTRDVGGVVIGHSSGNVSVQYQAPTRPASPRHEATRPRVWPSRSSNPLFRGRTAELDEIVRALSFAPAIAPATEQNTTPLKKPCALIIQGLGGTGKSELCIQYSEVHNERYWATFWVDASSESTLTSGYIQIAQQLALASDDPATVHRSLATREQKWLLVVDNADDPQLDLAPYLPSRGAGHVIITTRNPRLQVYSRRSPIRLDGLAKDDARALLFDAATIATEDQARLTIAADNILQTVSFHTLAIIQAGAYIRETRDFETYIQRFREQRDIVLQYCDAQLRAQYGSVYATFEVSASRLRQEADERQRQSAADALDLLQLFAFMGTRGPFERIFCDAKDFAMSCTTSSEPLTDVTNGVEVDDVEGLARRHTSLLSLLAYPTNELFGRDRWRKACNQLHQYSMVSYERDKNGDEILGFHPLILAWASARQSREEYQRSWLFVAYTIFLSSRGVRYHSPHLSRLGTHARRCGEHVLQDWWTEMSQLPFLFLLHYLAWILLLNRDDATNAKVCQCLEIGLTIAEKEQVRSAGGIESIRYLLGQHASNVGNVKKAVQLLEHVVKVREQTLAETHPGRLASQHALAGAFLSNGQVHEAVQLLEHVVKVREQTLAETHPSRLASQHALAGAYWSNGQVREAVQPLEHVVKVQEQTMAETYPSRLASERLLRSFKILLVQV